MNTTTTTQQLAADAGTLHTVLTVLDLYTTADLSRAALTLARVEPIIVEHVKDEPNTALKWEATDSYNLIQVTHRVAHTLTEATLIDPAAILATMPKKVSGDTVLTLTPETWELRTLAGTTTGRRDNSSEQIWPRTWGLFQDQHATIQPYAIDPAYLARLAKTAKQMKATEIRHVSQHKDGNTKPMIYTIDNNNMTARILIMPRRMN
jgi:hypothetical protein